MPPDFEPLTAVRRRQQTRDYLLQAAALVFAEHGFHGASLDQVAAAAGFTKGAVYSNFKNKEDLFLALIEAAYTREMEALKETLEDSEIPPENRLGDFVSLIRSELGTVPENWGALYLEFSLYAMRNPTARDRLNALEAEDIRAVAELILGSRTATEVASAAAESPAAAAAAAMTQARLITALFRGLNLMKALEPDAVGPDVLESAVAFVAR